MDCFLVWIAGRFQFEIPSASFKGAQCAHRAILIDVFENFRQIIDITNTADYSGFVVDAYNASTQ